ncbi:hypothetical protein [Sporolactobacillus laevolacticus]|uniref:hypothetical protein n=1 Tax=Sporolactobacillus laevolacticus TaxID=33018 RepID=UPI0025B2DBB5|nr:hypothetical protein [Sporolactobacillus laevolacticus]MDN3955954.1 hypothetical protein [Sporolactobacillus laevolacticus]
MIYVNNVMAAFFVKVEREMTILASDRDSNLTTIMPKIFHARHWIDFDTDKSADLFKPIFYNLAL